MERWNRLRSTVEGNRDLGLEAVRIFLGLALFAKGAYFAGHITDVMSLLNTDFNKMMLAHAIAMAHFAGGLLLAAGLLTRLSAAVQLPIVLGALFTVHLREGLFGASANLELTVLVALLLTLFVATGGGRWSADYLLAKRQALLEGHPFPPHVPEHTAAWRRVD
jgi:uncharacterized membrane protein YphA (DoxX/SURF4 family)